jgi:hypothetical protein
MKYNIKKSLLPDKEVDKVKIKLPLNEVTLKTNLFYLFINQ